MTLETKTLVSPTDIVGIEYECKHCGARYTVPVGKFDSAISDCPNCRTEIVSAAHKDGKESDVDALYSFVAHL